MADGNQYYAVMTLNPVWGGNCILLDFAWLFGFGQLRWGRMKVGRGYDRIVLSGGKAEMVGTSMWAGPKITL